MEPRRAQFLRELLPCNHKYDFMMSGSLLTTLCQLYQRQ